MGCALFLGAVIPIQAQETTQESTAQARRSQAATTVDADQTLLRSVEARLKENLRDSRIEIEVDDGKVTLEGDVGSLGTKVQAMTLTSEVSGVIDIDNQLKIRRAGMSGTRGFAPISDAELRNEIHDQFLLSPNVDGDRIQVEANQGRVTLRGTVGSEGERQKAVENAYEAGAKSVDDQLKLR